MKLRDLKEVDLNTNVSIIIYENDKILFEGGSAEAPGAYLDKVPEDYLDYKVLSLDIDDGVVEIKVKNIKPKEPKLIEQNKFLIKEHKMFRCDCCGSNMFSKYEGDKYKCQSCGQWYEIYNKKTGECAATHDQDEFCSKQVPEPFETVEEAEEYIRYLLETSPKELGLTLYDFEITKITREY